MKFYGDEDFQHTFINGVPSNYINMKLSYATSSPCRDRITRRYGRGHVTIVPNSNTPGGVYLPEIQDGPPRRHRFTKRQQPPWQTYKSATRIAVDESNYVMVGRKGSFSRLTSKGKFVDFSTIVTQEYSYEHYSDDEETSKDENCEGNEIIDLRKPVVPDTPPLTNCNKTSDYPELLPTLIKVPLQQEIESAIAKDPEESSNNNERNNEESINIDYVLKGETEKDVPVSTIRETHSVVRSPHPDITYHYFNQRRFILGNEEQDRKMRMVTHLENTPTRENQALDTISGQKLPTIQEDSSSQLIDSEEAQSLDTSIGSENYAVDSIEENSHNTNTSHWLPPSEIWDYNSVSYCRLPYGWEPAVDKSGKNYFINHVDKITSYEKPKPEYEEEEPPKPRDVVLKRDPQVGFGFVAGSEKPVIVRFVTEGGPSEGKLLPGDQIIKINGEDVKMAPREHVINLVRGCTSCIELTVVQPTPDNSSRKSALLTAGKKARLKNNPSRVRFAEGVTVNGLPICRNPSDYESCIPFMPNVLKVFLENGQTKSFKYDSKTTVKDVLDSLQEKLGVKAMEYFSLVLQHRKQYHKSKLSILPHSETLSRIAARPGAEHFRILFRVTFVPKDIYELLRNDQIAFEYFYTQCCNDVVQDRFAGDLKSDGALQLAALHIQQHALSNSFTGKISIKQVEKECGLEHYIPESVLHTLKKKEIRKLLSHYLKVNQNNHQKGQKEKSNLTVLQAKIQYLKQVSELQSFGVHAYNVMLRNTSVEVSISVGPKDGICQVTHAKNYIPTCLAQFSDVSCMSVQREGDHAHCVEIRCKDSTKDLAFIMMEEDGEDMLSVIQGYYYLETGQTLAIYFDRSGNDHIGPEVVKRTMGPEYYGEHQVIRTLWSYPQEHGEENAEVIVDLSRGPPKYDAGIQYEAYLNGQADEAELHQVDAATNTGDLSPDKAKQLVPEQAGGALITEKVNGHAIPAQEDNDDISEVDDETTRLLKGNQTDENVGAPKLNGEVCLIKEELGPSMLNEDAKAIDELSSVEEEAEGMLQRPLLSAADSIQLYYPHSDQDICWNDISGSDTDSLTTPTDSPVHHPSLSRPNPPQTLCKSEPSFGLISPDKFPAGFLPSEVEHFLGISEEEFAASMLFMDPDIIDLTLIPPPKTPDEDNLELLQTISQPPVAFADDDYNNDGAATPLFDLDDAIDFTRLGELSATVTPEPDIDSYIATLTIPPPPEQFVTNICVEDLSSLITPPPNNNTFFHNTNVCDQGNAQSFSEDRTEVDPTNTASKSKNREVGENSFTADKSEQQQSLLLNQTSSEILVPVAPPRRKSSKKSRPSSNSSASSLTSEDGTGYDALSLEAAVILDGNIFPTDNSSNEKDFLQRSNPISNDTYVNKEIKVSLKDNNEEQSGKNLDPCDSNKVSMLSATVDLDVEHKDENQNDMCTEKERQSVQKQETSKMLSANSVNNVQTSKEVICDNKIKPKANSLPNCSKSLAAINYNNVDIKKYLSVDQIALNQEVHSKFQMEGNSSNEQLNDVTPPKPPRRYISPYQQSESLYQAEMTALKEFSRNFGKLKLKASDKNSKVKYHTIAGKQSSRSILPPEWKNGNGTSEKTSKETKVDKSLTKNICEFPQTRLPRIPHRQNNGIRNKLSELDRATSEPRDSSREVIRLYISEHSSPSRQRQRHSSDPDRVQKQVSVPPDHVEQLYTGKDAFRLACSDIEDTVQEQLESRLRLLQNLPPENNPRSYNFCREWLVCESRQFISESKLLVSCAAQSNEQLLNHLNVCMHRLLRLIDACGALLPTMGSYELAATLAQNVKHVAVTFRKTIQTMVSDDKSHPKQNLMHTSAELSTCLNSLMKLLRELDLHEWV